MDFTMGKQQYTQKNVPEIFYSKQNKMMNSQKSFCPELVPKYADSLVNG